ncbi:MAG: hypothetical protein USCAAHI_01105 [Beijerinckiaceae bacterium]|nr:MAG: hypothetical protein USCAAHI_01105 [Beijerinckiaceae bacterium]
MAVATVNSIRLVRNRESSDASPMGDMLKLIWWAVIGLFRSRVSLEAEISADYTISMFGFEFRQGERFQLHRAGVRLL